MRRDVLVQICLCFRNQLGPVPITSPERFGGSGSIRVRALCVKQELVVGPSDVLGCLNESNGAHAPHLGSRVGLKVSPFALLGEVVECQIHEGNVVLGDGGFPVENCQDVVSLLDFGFVHCE